MKLKRQFRRFIGKRRRSAARFSGGSGVSNARLAIVTVASLFFMVAVLGYVHTRIIPIPLLVKSFLLYDADEGTFRQNLKTGELGDLRSEFKSWSNGESSDYHRWKLELLWNSGKYFAIGIGLILALGAFIVVGLNAGRRGRGGGMLGSSGPPRRSGRGGGMPMGMPHGGHGGLPMGASGRQKTVIASGSNSRNPTVAMNGRTQRMQYGPGMQPGSAGKTTKRRLPEKLTPPHYRDTQS